MKSKIVAIVLFTALIASVITGCGAATKATTTNNTAETTDGAQNVAGGVYAAYKGDDLDNVYCYYIFKSETEGFTETPDGVSSVPFTYEQNGEHFVFHFGSADDTTEAILGWDNESYPTLTFTGDEDVITLSYLSNQSPETFEAAKYYDNDNNLYMHVKSFDKTSFTGDLYHRELIKADIVDSADGSTPIYSVNGTQFTVVSFEDVNKEIGYGTDEEFKTDVVGTTRFDRFLVKCSEDNFYYALEKEEAETEYQVVSMMTDEKLEKLIEENVTFPIKENCEIILQKFVESDNVGHLEEESIIGRDFKGDNYPEWTENATEYYLTNNMIVALGVKDGEIYRAAQVYVP